MAVCFNVKYSVLSGVRSAGHAMRYQWGIAIVMSRGFRDTEMLFKHVRLYHCMAYLRANPALVSSLVSSARITLGIDIKYYDK
jgi:hypothetical protein